MFRKKVGLRVDENPKKRDEDDSEEDDFQIGWRDQNVAETLELKKKKKKIPNLQSEQASSGRSTFSSLFGFRPLWDNVQQAEEEEEKVPEEPQIQEKVSQDMVFIIDSYHHSDNEEVKLSPVLSPAKITEEKREKSPEIIEDIIEIEDMPRYDAHSSDSDVIGEDEKVIVKHSMDFNEIREEKDEDDDFEKFFFSKKENESVKKRKKGNNKTTSRKSQKLETFQQRNDDEDIEEFSDEEDFKGSKKNKLVSPMKEFSTPKKDSRENPSSSVPRKLFSQNTVSYGINQFLVEDIEEVDDVIEIEQEEPEVSTNYNWLEVIRTPPKVLKKNNKPFFNLPQTQNKKNPGPLSSKLYRSLSRINSEGQSNLNSQSDLTVSNLNDLNQGQVNYCDFTIIVETHSEFAEFYSTICKLSNQDEFVDVIFTKELKEEYQLSSGKSIRIFKPYSQYSKKELARKIILCPYFLQVLNDDRIDAVSQDFESLCEAFHKNLDDSRNSLIETPEKKRTSPSKVLEKVKETEEKTLPNIHQSISFFPIGDQNSTSITLIGIVQRVFRRKEPSRDEDSKRHIDYLQYHHLIIIQEVETNTLCILKIPFGEYDYWKTVFHGEGQILKFNCLSLVKRVLVYKKSPLYSIIRKFYEETANYYTVLEFHVQSDSTFDKQYIHQDVLDNTQTDSQMERIQKSSTYIKTEFHSIPDLTKLYSNIRVNIEAQVFHVHFPKKCNQPYCILYLQDIESKETKTYAQVNIQKKFFYQQLGSLEQKIIFKFVNLRLISKGVLEFDEFSSRKKSQQLPFELNVNNLNFQKGTVGLIQEEFVKIINNDDLFKYKCPSCKLNLEQDSKCPLHNQSIQKFNLKILLTNNIIITLNHSNFKRIYKEQFQKDFEETFDNVKEILSKMNMKFIVYLDDIVLNNEEKVIYNHVFLSKSLK